jgi:N-formylglutamate amidohydrolase
MILHIPHTSSAFPTWYADTIPHKSITTDTDWFVEKLFDGHTKFIYPYSRFYCDVERLPHETYELARTIDNQGNAYRVVDMDEIMTEYKSWQLKLKKQAEYLSSYYGAVIVADCHSFSASQLGLHESDVPDICIGYNDDNALPVQVMENVANFYRTAGYSVQFNYPYANAIKVSELPNVYSIMLEVNKRTYMSIVNQAPILVHKDWQKLRATNAFVLDYLTDIECGIIVP